MLRATTNINETQAIALTKQWLEHETGESYPVRSAFFVPETKAGKENDYIYDMPARWVVV